MFTPCAPSSAYRCLTQRFGCECEVWASFSQCGKNHVYNELVHSKHQEIVGSQQAAPQGWAAGHTPAFVYHFIVKYRWNSTSYLYSVTVALEQDTYETSKRYSCTLSRLLMSSLFAVSVRGPSSGINMDTSLKLVFYIKKGSQLPVTNTFLDGSRSQSVPGIRQEFSSIII